jgi:drug/metabolite transporter (DMT)-like permease
VFAGATGAVGDALLNHWAKSHRVLWLVVALSLWLVAAVSWAWLLKSERFSFSAAVILSFMVHSSLAVIFDRVYFGGRLSIWQWAGFVCALVAIILIDRGGTPVEANSAVQLLMQSSSNEP